MATASAIENSATYYGTKYDVDRSWTLRPGTRIPPLGDKENRKCRFCGKTDAEVSFGSVAHAIPESLGNKSLTTNYECDPCNSDFGLGIENDLGNWSKPIRTMVQIRGKSGVPTLKSTKDGWRIEYDGSRLNVRAYEDSPPFEVDVANNEAVFTLARDPYTPVAVLKAFMKMGLTLLPDDEVEHFAHLMRWTRSKDPSNTFANAVLLFHTLQPGPLPNDVVKVAMLRRQAGVTDVPYRYLAVSYGNETLQVHLPSQKFDEHLNGTSWRAFHYLFPDHPDPSLYGAPRSGTLNLSSSTIVRGDVVKATLHFEVAVEGDPRARANPSESDD